MKKDEALALEAKVAALEIALIAFMEQAPNQELLLQRLDAVQRDQLVSRFPAVCQHLNRLARTLAHPSSGTDMPSAGTH